MTRLPAMTTAILLALPGFTAPGAVPAPPLTPAFGSGRLGRELELSPQVLTLPPHSGAPRFIDVTGEGRPALLVLDPVERTLLNYPARAQGWSNAPAQTIALPPQTAWVGLGDVDAQPGLELLLCTPTELLYSRQTGGQFESERHMLIKGTQLFTNSDYPPLLQLPTNLGATNAALPVVSATEALLYHRDDAYHWSAGAPVALHEQHTRWSVTPDPWGDPWTLGPNPGHRLEVSHSVRSERERRQEAEPENAGLRKLRQELNKNDAPVMLDKLDVDGDGRQDVVLWQCTGLVDWKTDLYIFLRGADQKLPERPTQVLHCHGFPVPIGTTQGWSPVHDLNGDGRFELVLLEFKTSFVSYSALVKTALTHGVDWLLTIRTFHDGFFSHIPEAAVPVTMILPAEALDGLPLFICGDFNGDGRLDLVVRRSDERWHVFLSTSDGRWFEPEPALTFKTPPQGYMELKDLNGDGLTDIIWHEPQAHHLSVYFAPPRPLKRGAPR